MLAKLALLFQLAIPTIQHRPMPGNHTMRDTTITYAVLHYDSGVDYTSTRRWLIRKRTNYHYYIQRNGTIINMLNPMYEGAHAGLSYWDGRFRMNMYSVGICLQFKAPQQYTTIQYRNLAWLIVQLEHQYPDMRARPILGHGDIAWPRGRKKDPGPAFDWNRLYLALDSVRTAEFRRRVLTLDKR